MTESFQSDLLARILVLQSTFVHLRNKKQIVEFILAGIQEIPLVKEVLFWDEKPKEVDVGIKVFPVRYREQSFGFFGVQLKMGFEDYYPFLQNLFSTMGVYFEEKRAHAENSKYSQKLESEVRKRTLSLVEEKERAQKYLDIANALIIEFNLQGEVCLVNRQACEVVGYSETELLGDKWLRKVVATNERDFVQGVLGKLKNRDSFFIDQFESTLVDKKGEDHYVVWNNAPKFDGDGNLNGVICSGVEITERVRAEEAILREKELLSVTLRSVGEGVITITTAGVILESNASVSQLTGLERDDIIGQEISQVIVPKGFSEFQALEYWSLKIKQAAGPNKTEELEIIGENTSVVKYVQFSISPLLNPGSIAIGMVIVIRDITEQKKLDEQIARSSRLDSLGTLAGGIAHDFNNLLGGIFGYLEIARDSLRDNPEVAGYLEQAMVVFNRTKDLTQQLLTFSKGGKPIRKEEDIVDLVAKSCRFTFSGSMCEYEIKAPGHFSLVKLDKNQIGQVLDNLLLNACQAMEGKGKVEITLHESEYRNPINDKMCLACKITVSDQGCGIPEELLPKVFDPFVTSKKMGSGLGLATCHSIIKKHLGWISIDTELNIGTSVSVYLPLESKDNIILENKDFLKPCVIILDDEEYMLEIVSLILQRMGYHPIACRTGEECLIECQRLIDEEREINAALLDLTIPNGKGGKEIVEEMRAILPNSLLIAASGYSTSEVMAQPQEFGFDRALIKPYMKDELRRILQRD